MDKSAKTITHFDSEAEERAFWESPKNDSTEYLDCSKAHQAIFPNLKPSTRAISLGFQESLSEVWLDERARENREVRSGTMCPRPDFGRL